MTTTANIVEHGGMLLTGVEMCLFTDEGLLIQVQHINPLRAKFFRKSKNIYLRFISVFHIYMTQVAEILPRALKELAYST